MSSPRAVKTQRAALLAIGDEVLRGEISNTNAAFIAERLFEAGYELAEQVVVSDDPQSIRDGAGAAARRDGRRHRDRGPGADRGRPHGRRRGRAAGHRHVAGRAVAGGDEEAVLDARLRADAQQPAPGAHPERRQGAAQHGRDRARVRRPPGHRRGVLPARRAARDGEDVHRRGDAAAGAPAGRDGRAAAGRRAPGTSTGWANRTSTTAWPGS